MNIETLWTIKYRFLSIFGRKNIIIDAFGIKTEMHSCLGKEGVYYYTAGYSDMATITGYDDDDCAEEIRIVIDIDPNWEEIDLEAGKSRKYYLVPVHILLKDAHLDNMIWASHFVDELKKYDLVWIYAEEV